MTDADAPNTDDRLGADDVTTQKFSPAIENFLAAANGTDEDAEERYREMLDTIREQGTGRFLAQLAMAMNQCDGHDYETRWMLTHAASELDDRDALPLLTEIVMQRIPPEESRDPHSFSSVAEETIIRTTAVAGVERLAANGDKAAYRALLEFLEVPALSVRRAAVQAAMAVTDGDKATRKQIRRSLPENQHFLLDIERVEVTDVPQIEDPQSTLTERGREDSKPEPPRFEDDAPERRTPKAR
jgi:hypothetical protein